jgi:four helix bundle protein
VHGGRAVGVGRYEDLRVWQEARSLSDEVGRILDGPAFRRDFALRKQLDAAVLSTVVNIAEGFVRRRRREFAQFVRIAAGSNAEARALLQVAVGRGLLAPGEAASLIERTNVVGRMLRRLLDALERPDSYQAPRTKRQA